MYKNYFFISFGLSFFLSIAQNQLTATNDTANTIVLTEASSEVTINDVWENKLKIGIYTLQGDYIKEIYPSTVQGTRNNGALLSTITFWMVPYTSKAFVPHARSSNTVEQQEFIFSFPIGNQDVISNNLDNEWFRTASSPYEFVLLRLKSKKGRNIRQFTTSSGSWLGIRNGIDPKKVVQFSIEPLENNMYRIVPSTRLVAGEYCFIYQGGIPNNSFENKLIFDFSIK
ncbi:hypothetical protein [Costertonia aggregata]|uniref:Uncharacterized protein n=1 Tax=Costertonia aggregata TaxID=343403 RepID=A0A7H9ALU8_9FLAO|nr:hypothetical protein [Costertonia aggregata]QLG44432.1 hypothetical protein HYG79_03410 [Costertonia aggregata]